MSDNIDVNVNVNTQQAQRNLDALNQKVGVINSTFAKLKTAIAGIAFGNMISSALQYADAISDISDATGIAVQNVVGFSKAVATAGGDSEKAQQGLLKFVQTIGEAANGSASAQDAFKSVGVSLNDLRTLSEQELLAKVIANLGQIGDKSEQARLKMELFGKSMRSVSAEGLAAGYDQAVAKAQKYAEAIKAAGQTQQNIEDAMGDFKIAILAALQPITEFTKSLNTSIETMVNVIKILLALGTAILAMTLWGKLIQAVAGAFTLMAGAAESVQAVILSLSIRLGNLGRIGAWLSDKLASVGIWFSEIVTKSPAIAASISFIGAALSPIIGLFAGAGVAIGSFWDKIKNFMGFKSPKVDTSIDDAETKKLLRQQNAVQKSTRNVEDALAKQKLQLLQNTEAFRRQGNEIVKNLQLEAAYNSLSDDSVEILKAQNDAYKRSADEIQKLRDQKALLKPEEKELAGLIDKQITIIDRLGREQANQVAVAIEGLQRQKAAQDELNHSLDMKALALKNDETAKQLTEDLSLIGLYGEELKKQQSYIAAQRALRASLMELQNEENRLIADKTKLGEDNFNREMRQLNEKRAAAQQVAVDAVKNAETVRAAEYQSSRSFEQGWKQAFDTYLENGTNAAKMAGDAFSAITSNMERAIDNFVETGKFSFSDFARSIIQDLIKIELKAQATKLLGALGGGGGIFSAIGSLFGFADGGNPPVNKPSLVGEKGPELFVPKTAGTIVPNGAMGGPITNNYISYNIDAIDSRSVAQFFAENRKTMLGTIQLAQKELPYANK